MIAIAPGQQFLTVPDRIRSVEAWVDGQVIEIAAQRRASVARVHVTKDQLVHRGDPLADLERGGGDRPLAAAASRIEVPVPGRILAIEVGRGDHLDRKDPVASILYRNELWVLARFERHAFARLRTGQYARIRTPTHVLLGRVGGLRGPSDPVLLDLVGRSATALHPGMPAAVAVEVD
jgi:multidrug resistance efflux pump